jgi:pyruvate formate lyase activating enzyme
MYKRDDPATSEKSMKRLFDIASEKLDYVYMGNDRSETGKNTYCPNCGSLVTVRSGYRTNPVNLDEEGKCSGCGNQVYKYFTFSLQKKY